MTRTSPLPGVVLRRSQDRFHTRTAWLDSRHSFSFGAHYDPADTHFGLLLASNEDLVAPGGGFVTHPHRDLEIVTWVLAGSLVHEDSAGHRGLVHPGVAQRLSAGSGIRHAERSGSDASVHLVQMWVVPDTPGAAPGYERRDIRAALATGELVVVASGMARHGADRAVSIGQEQAALHAARLGPGGIAEVPEAPFVHVFVARGTAGLEGAGMLGTGDAARITGGGGQRLTAGRDGAEVLVWEMHAALGGWVARNGR
jgi:quercetin 2,3-dioxygenase